MRLFSGQHGSEEFAGLVGAGIIEGAGFVDVEELPAMLLVRGLTFGFEEGGAAGEVVAAGVF